MASKKEIERQKEAMRKLGMTEEDIKELMQYDKQVMDTKDTDVPLQYDLKETEKQEVAKASTITTGKKEKKAPTVYNFDNEGGKRSNKKDTEKEEIIAKIAEFLTNSVENLEIINPSQKIGFNFHQDTYEITLTKKRKPKN